MKSKEVEAYLALLHAFLTDVCSGVNYDSLEE
jgi:hypothetical protein